MIDNDKGWVTSFPFGENESITRFNIVHAERRHAPASEPVTADEVRRCLTDVLEKDLPFDDLVWASRFTDSLRIATKFQQVECSSSANRRASTIPPAASG